MADSPPSRKIQPNRYTSGDTINDASNWNKPPSAPCLAMPTIARMKAARFNGQPISRPLPGIGIRKHTQAITRQIHAARPAPFGAGCEGVIAFIETVLVQVPCARRHGDTDYPSQPMRRPGRGWRLTRRRGVGASARASAFARRGRGGRGHMRDAFDLDL